MLYVVGYLGYFCVVIMYFIENLEKDEKRRKEEKKKKRRRKAKQKKGKKREAYEN